MVDNSREKDGFDSVFKGNGCSFGRITRERIDNFIKTFENFRDNDFKHLASKMSGRPSWAVSTVIWILSSTVVGLLVRIAILGY